MCVVISPLPVTRASIPEKFTKLFFLGYSASDALTLEPVYRSGSNFADILFIGWSEYLQNLAQIGILVPELGRHRHNTLVKK